jgi:hypothetical protein
MKYLIFLLKIILITSMMPGCAYIIGGRTTTHLNAKSPDTKISILYMGKNKVSVYKPIGQESVKYNLKNYRDYIVKQEREGYIPKYTPLAQTRFNYGKIAGLAASLGFGIFLYALASSSSDNEILDNAIGIGGVIAFFGSMGLFTLGPPRMYEKEINLPEMELLPKKKNGEKNLVVEQAAINMTEHSYSYNYYPSFKDYKNGENSFSASQGERTNIQNTVFSEDLNILLAKYGYGDTTTSTSLPNAFNSLKLRTTITGINLTRVGEMSFIKISTDWSLYDYYGKIEMISKYYITESNWTSAPTPDEQQTRTMFKDALDGALTKFLSDTAVSWYFKNGTVESDKKFANWDTLHITSDKYVSSVSDAVKAVVTVKGKDGHGSGCLISKEGWIITNYHVSGDTATKLEVLFENEQKDSAVVIRVNPNYDLALLKVKPVSITPLNISNAKLFEVGQTVYAIGTPDDIELGQTVSKGIISGKRKVDDKIYIQTDVSINSGDSGGALITEDGTLVGIVNAKLIGIGVEGIGFAIPGYYIREALKISNK